MPFTPFHLGPSSWIGLLLLKIFDFPTLLIASVIIDIEPLFILALSLNHPLHGFFHSFIGGSILAILTAVGMYFLKNNIRKIMGIFKLEQDLSFKKILWTSFFGVYFHILLDSFIYTDIKPFYPFESNPLYGTFSSHQIYLFCSLSFLIGALIYLVRLLIAKRAKDNSSLK